MSRRREDDRRGRSDGSRATQFSSDNQPNRRSRRRVKRKESATGILHALIYEKVPLAKGGKKIPYVEALLKKLRNEIYSAGPGEKIKFFIELTRLGIFEVEEYKDDLFRRMNNHFKELKQSYERLADFLDEIGPAYRRASLLYLIYFQAYVNSARACTCGACEKGFDAAGADLAAAWEQVVNEEEDDEEDFEEVLPEDDEEEGEEALAEDDPPSSEEADDASDGASKPHPPPDGLDDEFYRGMGFD